MSGPDRSCAQRIRQELADRERGYAALWEQLDNPDAADGAREAVYEQLDPLSIEVRPVVTVLLSWGGPSDWLELELEPGSGYDIRRVIYHFADWFDHAERELTQQEAPALWRAAGYYAEYAQSDLARYEGLEHAA